MRTRYSIINILVAWCGQFSVLAFQLLNRYVFARTLSAEYMGISGLFSNILSMLALAELGVGSAMTFSLYVPLVQHDTEKIKSLMRLYRSAYRTIGCIVLGLGLALLPVYPHFIAEDPGIPNLDIIYVLYVLSSATTYFCSYKRSLIISDQRKYLESLVYYSRQAVMNILQIILLITTRNFILFLVCQIVCTLAENAIISSIANRMYPYLKDKTVAPLAKEDFSMIKRNIGALVTHKIGGIVFNSTSSILISRFINLAVAGFYSSYTMISNAVSSIVGQAFNAITGSVGNLEASENPNKILAVFHKIYFFNFYSIGFCTICLLLLFQPFIRLWLGDGYLLGDISVILIVSDFYIQGMRKSVLTFRDASASYYYDRYKPIVESVINLGLSLWLIQLYGLVGLIIGRLVSTILTCSWVEPFVLYKHVFFEKFSDFGKRFISYGIVILLDSFVASKLFDLIIPAGSGLWHFIIQLFVAIIISLGLMTLSTFWMKEFRELADMCNGLAMKLIQRNKG